MSRTIPDLLDALDNLAGSWKTMGHPTQAKVQAEALAELRQHLAGADYSHERPRNKRR